MVAEEKVTFRLQSAQVDAVIFTPYDGVSEKVLNTVKRSRPNRRFWSVQKDVESLQNLTLEMWLASATLERLHTLADNPMVFIFHIRHYR